MGMDTYTIRVMHCPVCDHQASHRAVIGFPGALCHRCKGVKLSRFIDYKGSQCQAERRDHAGRQDAATYQGTAPATV